MTQERKVDELGRIVLPRPFRELLNIQEKDVLTVTLQDGVIILAPAKQN